MGNGFVTLVQLLGPDAERVATENGVKMAWNAAVDALRTWSWDRLARSGAGEDELVSVFAATRPPARLLVDLGERRAVKVSGRLCAHARFRLTAHRSLS